MGSEEEVEGEEDIPSEFDETGGDPVGPGFWVPPDDLDSLKFL